MKAPTFATGVWHFMKLASFSVSGVPSFSLIPSVAEIREVERERRAELRRSGWAWNLGAVIAADLAGNGEIATNIGEWPPLGRAPRGDKSRKPAARRLFSRNLKKWLSRGGAEGEGDVSIQHVRCLCCRDLYKASHG